MPNEENLIENDKLTAEERRARASKAGKASVAARRRRKAMKAALNELMTLPPDSKEAKRALDGLGEIVGADNQTAMLAGLMKKAMKGDTKAVKELRNILGESTPSEKAERKAKIDHAQASTRAIQAKVSAEPESVEDDGFMRAIGGAATEWESE